MTIEKKEIQLFHEGIEIKRKPSAEAKPEISREAEKKLYHLYKLMESHEKQVYLVWDLDGVLVKAGIETANIPETLDEYALRNEKLLKKFQERVKKLRKFGFKLGINTGRGVEFTSRIIDKFFPSGGVDKVVCEGGAVLLEGDNLVLPKSVNRESLETLKKNKDSIISYVSGKLGGYVEAGKAVIISLNSPKNEVIDIFFDRVKKYLREIGILDKLEITHSATAVDITPIGADKLEALKEVLGENMSVYFGDAKSDEDAMKRSVGNIVPGNAMKSTKEQAREATFGLLSKKNELEGVVDTLWNIEMYARFARIKAKKGIAESN